MAHGRRGLAWVAFTVVAVIYAAAIVILATNPLSPGREWSNTIFFISTTAFPIVGVLVASRRPDNPIGWILLAIGAAWASGALVDSYATRALDTHPGSLPAPDIVLAITGWWWVAAVGLMGTFLLLLFPDGRYPSERWRSWGWLAGFALAANAVLAVVMPGPFTSAGHEDVTNPLGFSALAEIPGLPQVALGLLVVAILGSAAGLIQRFRRSTGQVRLQMKWLTFGASVTVVAFASMLVLVATLEAADAPEPAWLRGVQTLTFLSFVSVPVAVGVAILRHRLYDVDLIINRALVYGGLTTMLALTYSLGVFIVGSALGTMRGDGNNNIAVATSTLLVAALFRPLRGRLQAFIDHRFYRRKYDAARTVEGFTARLRDQIDLDSLTTELATIAYETMQPTRVSVWLRHRSPQPVEDRSDLTQPPS